MSNPRHLLVSFFCLISLANANHLLSDSLAGWWSFQNGELVDVTGGQQVGTMFGNVTVAEGIEGDGLYFDGSSYVIINSDAMNELPLTLSAWVKPELRTTPDLAHYNYSWLDYPSSVLSNDRPGHHGHGLGYTVYVNEGRQISRLVTHSHTWDAGHGFRIAQEGEHDADEWVHIAVVYRHGLAQSFFNGVLVDEWSYTQGSVDGMNHISIGRHNSDSNWFPNGYFKGTIDEISIYRRALSEDEIQSLYRHAGQLSGPPVLHTIPSPLTDPRPEFAWSSRRTDGLFRLEIDTAIGFHCPYIALWVEDTSLFLPADLPPDYYFWRVLDPQAGYSDIDSFSLEIGTHASNPTFHRGSIPPRQSSLPVFSILGRKLPQNHGHLSRLVTCIRKNPKKGKLHLSGFGEN